MNLYNVIRTETDTVQNKKIKKSKHESPPLTVSEP